MLDDLVEKVRQLQEQGRVVVQSHGVWDLIHPGNLSHLQGAARQGDVLVVTVIRDQHVRRGPGRPVFPEKSRAESVAALEVVDYVAIVDDEIPFECVKWIRPDVFAKGKNHAERDAVADQGIFEEEKELGFVKTRTYFTDGFSFSSSDIAQRLLNLYPDETKRFLLEFSQRYSFEDIRRRLDGLHDLKLLLIGDTIVDEYCYCGSLEKASKSHVVVSKFLEEEAFAGGVLAVANHLAGILDQVHMVTMVGHDELGRDFVPANLNQAVQARYFVRHDGPTVVKRRYLHQYLNQKLFEINYINDNSISPELEEKIIAFLEDCAADFDAMIVTDFGHGLMSEKIVSTIQKQAKVCVVNTQTNGANSGFNFITRYSPDFVCLDEREARLATQEKHLAMDQVLKKLFAVLGSQAAIVTLGRQGSISMDQTHKILHTPIFSTKVVDTIGAGDALFAFVAPCLVRGFPLDLVSFLGNAVGALAVQIVGNKAPVTKFDLYQLIYSLLSISE